MCCRIGFVCAHGNYGCALTLFAFSGCSCGPVHVSLHWCNSPAGQISTQSTANNRLHVGNLVSILAHCGRGQDLLLGDDAHIFHYEVCSIDIDSSGSIDVRAVAFGFPKLCCLKTKPLS
jgi:hypothetical protein